MTKYDTPFSATFHTIRQLSSDPLYGKTVVVDSSIQARLQNRHFQLSRPVWDAQADMVSHLNTMTGQTFTVTNTPPGNGTAIFVVTRQTLLDHGDTWLPPDTVTTEMSQLAGKPDNYLLYSSGAGGLWIVGGGTVGCMHGVYDYLRRLGMEPLFPGPESVWLDYPSVDAVTGVVTHLTDITLAVNEVCLPFIKGVLWAPQDGYYSPAFPNDNDGFAPGDAWYKWLIRLGRPYGYNYISGSAVNSIEIGNLATQAQGGFVTTYLNADSAYAANPLVRPMINGVRLSFGVGALNQTMHDDIATVTVEGTENPTDYTSYNGVPKAWNDAYDTHARTPFYSALATSYYSDPDLVNVSTAEPSDGAPLDYSPKSKALLRNGPYPGFNGSSPDSSPIDRVVHFANRMAVHVVETKPAEKVAIYSYNASTNSAHETIPNIPLHPNNQVIVTSEIFCAAAPKDYQLAQWAAKRDANMWDGTNQPFELGLYHFMGIHADEGHNEPRRDLFQFFHKIRYWQDYNVQTFYGESTPSVCTIGHHWFLLLKALWDRPSGDPTAYCLGVIDDWWERAFPTAAVRALVRARFDAWQLIRATVTDGTRYFTASPFEWGELLNNLHDAQALVTPGSIEDHRLAWIEGYALMQLYFDVALGTSVQSTDGPTLEAAFGAAMFQAYYTHVFTVNQTFIMDSAFGYASQNSHLSSAYKNKWNWGIATVGGQTWTQRTGVPIPPDSISTFAANMHTACATEASNYPRLGLTHFTPADEWDLVTVGALDSLTTSPMESPLNGSTFPYNGGWMAFLSAGTGVVTFGCYSAAVYAVGRVTLVHPDGSQVVTYLNAGGLSGAPPLPGSGFASVSWDLSTLPTGLYRILYEPSNADALFCTMKYPRNVPFSHLGWRSHTFVRDEGPVFDNVLTGTFFYVPRGCTRFALSNGAPDTAHATPHFFVDGNGTEITNTEIMYPNGTYSNLFTVDVPNGQDAKVWCVKNLAISNFRLMNIPNIWARQASQLLVPRSMT